VQRTDEQTLLNFVDLLLNLRVCICY